MCCWSVGRPFINSTKNKFQAQIFHLYYIIERWRVSVKSTPNATWPDCSRDGMNQLRDCKNGDHVVVDVEDKSSEEFSPGLKFYEIYCEV